MASATAVRPSDDHEGWSFTETLDNPLGGIEFKGGYPTAGAARRLADQLVLNRAVEGYLAHVRAVSGYRAWRDVREAGPAMPNQLVIWQSPMESRTLLGGNSETVYAQAALDLTRDGPVVLEVPPMLVGGLAALSQRPLFDVGPAGADRGKG